MITDIPGFMERQQEAGGRKFQYPDKERVEPWQGKGRGRKWGNLPRLHVFVKAYR
jgi:hypothetical protein